MDNIITVKLPIKIARIGAARYDNNESVILWGGIYKTDSGEYTYIDTVYKMDFQNEKLFKMPKMNSKRIWQPYIDQVNEAIYVLGGCDSKECEYLDVINNRWVPAASYSDILPDSNFEDFWAIAIPIE